MVVRPPERPRHSRDVGLSAVAVLGLWLVMVAPAALDARCAFRIVAAWAVVFAIFVVVFIANYLGAAVARSSLPRRVLSRRRLAAAIDANAFAPRPAATLRYVIGSMWDGGNLAHYSPDQPRVLIDGGRDARPGSILPICAGGAVVVGPKATRELPPHLLPSRPAPRSARRSICRSAAATAQSMSAGRSCRHDRISKRSREDVPPDSGATRRRRDRRLGPAHPRPGSCGRTTTP